jgi:hypothetical protein
MAKYDPETGEKLRFDPETGEQLPLTGVVENSGATPPPSGPPPAGPPPGYAAPQAGKRKGLIPLLIAAVVLVLIAGGVLAVTLTGSDGGGEKAEGQTKADRAAAVKACQAELGDYVASLKSLDTQLDVGMNIEAYSAIVREIAVEQAAVNGSNLAPVCGQAKEAADRAFDLYTKQASKWDDCIWNDYCDPEGLDLSMKWFEASLEVADAEESMNGTSAGDEL